MVYYLITLPVTLAFIANGFGQLYYALRLRNKFPKEHNFNNSVFAFFLWITAGFVYPFYYTSNSPQLGGFLFLATFFICIFTPFMIFLILLYQYLFVIKKHPEIKQQRTIKKFLKEYDARNEGKVHNFKTDLHRKMLHLFPATVIISLWVFAVYIWAGMWNADASWGITGQEFGKFLILTAGYSGILVFAALDYVRLSYIFEKRNIYHLLPGNVLDLLGKAMKRKEIFEFTKPAALVLAMAPVFIFPFGVFASAALIATIGDGAASVIGMKYGKSHFPKSSNKTIIGYVAGFIASFGIAVLCLWAFEPSITLIKVAIIALSGALMFFITDLLSLEVDDNMLNPLCCALIMGFFFYLI